MATLEAGGVVRIPFRKGVAGAFALFGLAMVAGSVLIFWLTVSSRTWIGLGLAIPGLLLFTGWVAFFGWAALTTGPGLIVDKEGLVDRSSALAFGRIRWNEVGSIEFARIRGQRVVYVFPVTPGILGRANRLKRLMMRLNRRLVGAPIGISASLLAIPSWELHRLLSGGHRRWNSRTSVSTPL